MEDEIKRRAYELWEADGSPAGDDQVYWFKAVAELAAATAASMRSPRRRSSRAKKAA